MWDAYFYIIEDISLKLIKCILKKKQKKRLCGGKIMFRLNIIVTKATVSVAVK